MTVSSPDIVGPVAVYPNPAETAPPPAQRITRRFLGALSISALVGIILWGALVYNAGIWNILANTRLLDVLIKGGVVAYTDQDGGFIEGVPNHEYYLASQDPINWSVMFVVGFLFLVFWAIKAIQFHEIARYHGLKGTLAQHGGAYFFGLGYKKVTPFHIGQAATVAALHADGAPLNRALSTMFLFDAFVILEIVLFSLYGLFALGWSVLLVQLFWALTILAVFYRWTRPEYRLPGEASYWGAIQAHLRELMQRPAKFLWFTFLSVLAFGLEDLAAYFVAMAFTSPHVILNVDFSLLLMGVVGSYIARLVPLSPGGLGQFEWGFAAALYLGGMGFPEAATIAILDNFFRYLAFIEIWVATLVVQGARAGFQAILRLAHGLYPVDAPAAAAAAPVENAVSETGELTNVPAVPRFHIPALTTLCYRAVMVGWVLLGYYFFDQLTQLFANFWLLQSIGLESVFWTNFNMGATLFVVAFLWSASGPMGVARSHNLPATGRLLLTHLGLQLGLIAGYLFSHEYLDFLLAMGVPFNKPDPIFGYDIGFYIYTLPAISSTVTFALELFALLLLLSGVAAFVHHQRTRRPRQTTNWLLERLAGISTPFTLYALAGTGVSLAVSIWLSRFNLLYKDNSDSAIPAGAEYLDVTGLFSTLNQIHVTALVVLGVTIALVMLLRKLNQSLQRPGGIMWGPETQMAAQAIATLIVFDFAFAGAVYVRDVLAVVPNEPVVQLPYIQHHLDATRAAYRLDQIEEVTFIPKDHRAPRPKAETILASPTMQNVPLWPPFSNYLERVIDPEYRQRIFQTDGETLIYGPTLETFRQQQKLRTYYDFLSVAPLRFPINGETQVFASAVREVPLIEPKPWLAWWGQRYMLFTHGHGLVMAPVGQATVEGEPIFVSREIPVRTDWPELAAGNPQIYYGEGAASMAFSNVRNVHELDYPTEQGRAENTLPADAPIGVRMDSMTKRIVFGWLSGQFWTMVFSDLITPDTRVHYLRTPVERLQQAAPFLYFDANAYAIPTTGDIEWLVNGLTASDMYPYSMPGDLGDKSVSRLPVQVPVWKVNYVEDAVKATVNAYNGQVRLYKISNDPVIESWAEIYPDLFTDPAEMPADVRQQVTYPLQLFHLQFDDLYIVYHMNDPMYFFNMEDMWDDGDEVVGPILDQGRAITFSIEPYHLVLETGGLLPAAQKRSQFAMMAVFTPENALNLRALPIVYQDGEDYGRLVVLQVPKGQYVLGPEQADAMMDQTPEISQNISWWNRRGTEVIRGHTSTLVIDGELIYIEPLFLRSRQNPVPQLHRVIVVFRGEPYMAETLEAALRQALDPGLPSAPVVTTMNGE